MNKPMYCPMLFAMSAHYHLNEPMECTPDCAWAVIDGHPEFEGNRRYACGIIAVKDAWVPVINSRPLKDDDE